MKHPSLDPSPGGRFGYFLFFLLGEREKGGVRGVGRGGPFRTSIFIEKSQRGRGVSELKKCTVSGLKRQFDKWHLFARPPLPLGRVSAANWGIWGGGGVGGLIFSFGAEMSTKYLFRPKLAQRKPEMITSHDVCVPLKQVLLASRGVIISSQILGSMLQRVLLQ